MFLVKEEENINAIVYVIYTIYIHIYIYHTNICLCIYKILMTSPQCHNIAKVDPSNTNLDVVLKRGGLYNSIARQIYILLIGISYLCLLTFYLIICRERIS